MENTSITTKYVRKPLFVDAVQVTEQNFADIARWCFGEIGNIDESPVDRSADVQPTKQYIHVRVHNPKEPAADKSFCGRLDSLHRTRLQGLYDQSLSG